MGAEVLNSSASGFLIIPGLKDSVYEWIIGFQNSQYPEYRFRGVAIRGDRGISLKDFGEKGWGFVDIRSSNVIMGEIILGKPQAREPIPPPLTNDAFTVILASVIDDPSLPGTELVRAEMVTQTATRTQISPAAGTSMAKGSSSPPQSQPKEPAETRNATTDSRKSTAQTGNPAAAPGIQPTGQELAAGKQAHEKTKDQKTVPAATARKPETGMKQKDTVGPSKLRESRTSEGLMIAYVDFRKDGGSDTVRILIPAGESRAGTAVVAAVEAKDTTRTVSNPAATLVSPVPAADQKAITAPLPNDSTAGIPVQVAAPVTTRTDCRKMAAEKDIASLRKKMLGGAEDDDLMVEYARREFKQKCYSTDQVRELSFMFTNDQGRYKLLDAAYAYVYDPDAYPALESILSDTYFIKRFRAMLK